MVLLPAEVQRQSSIQKATRQGSVLWLEVDNLPQLTKSELVLPFNLDAPNILQLTENMFLADCGAGGSPGTPFK